MESLVRNCVDNKKYKKIIKVNIIFIREIIMISKLNIISKFLFLLTLLLVCLPNSKKAIKRVRLKTQFLFPSQIMEKIGILEVFNRINTFSGNKIKFRIYEPNSIVPNFELWEAVSQNQLQAAITLPGILAMKIPAITFFCRYPFWPEFY